MWNLPDLITLALLLGASILDWKTRRVSNKYWYPAILLAALFLWRYPITTTELITATATLPLIYLLWHTRLIAGGADAKALMVIAWLDPHLHTTQLIPQTTTWNTLTNAILITILIPLAFMLYNLATGKGIHKHTWLGLEKPTNWLHDKHWWLMQTLNDDNTTKWEYWPKNNQPRQEILNKRTTQGHQTTWATPKIPFMIPLLIGYLIHQQHGNLLITIMTKIITP